jgi:hypothetical protein
MVNLTFENPSVIFWNVNTDIQIVNFKSSKQLHKFVVLYFYKL